MKKTLVVMMAFMIGLAVTSCKQSPKTADSEVANADAVQAMTELLEKTKAEGANWSVDEWKDAYKVALGAIAPAMKEVAGLMESIESKDGEDGDSLKLIELLAGVKALKDKYKPLDDLMNEFESISKSYPNGKAVNEDEVFFNQVSKELGLPE